MRIAAVVVTYNRKQLLSECLGALLNQTKKLDSVIVIDNASTDGTRELFTDNGLFNLPDIDYCPMENNLGGAGGFYEGIKRAYTQGYDWIWIMDDDTIPQEKALEEFLLAEERIEGKISFLASAVYGINHEPMNVPNIETAIVNILSKDT